MIELVLTLSIIAVLGVIAVPKINNSRIRHNEQNAIRTVQRAIAYSSAEARRRTVEVIVEFNSVNELLAIVGVQSGKKFTIPWRGSVAGTARHGDDKAAWYIKIDPHGRVVEETTPATLKAALTRGYTVSSKDLKGSGK